MHLSAPRLVLIISFLPAITNIKSFSSKHKLFINSSFTSSVNIFAILPANSLLLYFKKNKPFALYVLTKSVNLSISFLEYLSAAFFTTIAFIIPLSSSSLLNNSKSHLLNTLVTSFIFISNLKSGLSDP